MVNGKISDSVEEMFELEDTTKEMHHAWDDIMR